MNVFPQADTSTVATCFLPEIRFIEPLMDRKIVNHLSHNMDITIEMDSIIDRYKTSINLQEKDSSILSLSFTSGYYFIVKENVAIQVWNNDSGIISEFRIYNTKTCSISSYTFEGSGKLSTSFYCDYSNRCNCIYTTYANGIPIYFSECLPTQYLENNTYLLDTQMKKEFKISFTKSGYYDQIGNQHYFPK